MKESLKADLQASMDLHGALLENDALHTQLIGLAQLCLQSLHQGNKIIFAGNGGSFADAQHLAAEFVSRLQFDRAPLPAVALATNSSCMSAIGNDYGYDQVFARELKAIGRPGDVFVPITTSGNSPNILAAVTVAQDVGIQTMGFTGKGGGKLGIVCPCLSIPATRTERIQEGHILLGHILCALVETAYFGSEQLAGNVKEEGL
jgi:D-sedoheptulose 7-phosphate isomerase